MFQGVEAAVQEPGGEESREGMLSKNTFPNQKYVFLPNSKPRETHNLDRLGTLLIFAGISRIIPRNLKQCWVAAHSKPKDDV